MSQNPKIPIFIFHNEKDPDHVLEIAEGLGKRGFLAKTDITEMRRKLRQLLLKNFNREEIRTLSNDTGLNHENLPDTIEAMAREFIAQCTRMNLIPKLLTLCKEQRPHGEWEKVNEYTQKEFFEVLDNIHAVLVLFGKNNWELNHLKSYLSEFEKRNLPIIPVLLPEHNTVPPEYNKLFKGRAFINLEKGINSGISLLVWSLNKNEQKTSIESSQTLSKQFSETQTLEKKNEAVIDPRGISLIKNRLYTLSEFVAEEAGEEAIRSSTIYPYDVFTMMVPLIISLRWHRGYKSAIERLLNLPKPRKFLSAFKINSLTSHSTIIEGVLSAEKNDKGQIVVKLDKAPAALIQDFPIAETGIILQSINSYGRLGAPETGGLSLTQRIGTIPLLDQNEKFDEKAMALYRNRQALIPLLTRLGIPGGEWLLPTENDLPKPGESLLNENVSNQKQKEELFSELKNESSDVIVEEDYIANRGIGTKNPHMPPPDVINKLLNNLNKK